MSNSESDESQSVTSSRSGFALELSSHDDANYGVVQNQVGDYQFEPLANLEDEEDAGPANHDVDDPDGLFLETLESRFEKKSSCKSVVRS